MRIFGVSNPKGDNYPTIQQIALNPDNLDWFVQGYIIWYKDWVEDKDPLDVDYSDTIEIFQDGWKIWKCNSRIFNCSYKDGLINSFGEGVLEIEYEKGNPIDIKYWNTKNSYFKHNKPDFIYEQH